MNLKKKLNTKDIIKLCKNVHGNKYDYSNLEYINARTKIEIICPVHGSFFKLPAQHYGVRQEGCPKCSNKFNSIDDFIEKSNIIHNNKYDYSNSIWNGTINKLKIICPTHGEFEQFAYDHLRSRGCPKCANDARANNLLDTSDKFIEKANIVHNNKYDYSNIKYINSRTKIKIICPEHGYFYQKPYSHLEGAGCPICNPKRKKDINYFIEQSNTIHNFKYDYSKSNYIDSKIKLKIICPIHGEFEQTPSEHMSGSGCRKCAIENNKHTIEKFINKAKDIHDNRYYYEDSTYESSKRKVKITCPEHGIFEQRPNNHLMGQGCPKCYSINSKLERNIFNYFIKNNPVQSNRTIIHPKEIDIYFKDYNLALEINGNYWHSELNGKDKNYHLNKTIECENKGVQLFHILESDLINNLDIIYSMINNKLGNSKSIFARKCKIKEISNKEKDMFLENTHLQGKDISSIRIGLYFEDELVSVMTFCKSRFNKKYQWELSRFSSKLNTTIVGGASKLFSYFIKTYNPKSIITYSDRRHSNGNLYKKLGFYFSHYSSPNYFYTHKSSNYMELYSRHQFQKHKLKDKLEIFHENLSEWENMKLNGYDRIWDCGNGVWIKNFY